MKFRFKVLKNGFHDLQYKRFIFWHNFSKSPLLKDYVYNKKPYLYRGESEDYYREYLKEVEEMYTNRCVQLKKDRELHKTDYFIY